MSESREEAEGKNLSDVITKPVKSFDKCGGIGVRRCRAEVVGLRKKKLKLWDVANMDSLWTPHLEELR